MLNHSPAIPKAMRRLIRTAAALTILLLAVRIPVAQEVAKGACVPASSPPRKTVPVPPIEIHQGPIELHCGEQTVNQAPATTEQHTQPKLKEPTILQLLEGCAKLASSLAWPLFALVVLVTFRRQFGGLIGRIKSIELGNNKVVLDTQLKPTSAPKQATKAREENQESEQGQAIDTMPQLKSTPRTKALLAEDLALRALQEEYGASIRRQVTAGDDPGFDGAFVVENRLYIVEVKYFRSSFLPDKLESSILRLASSINRYGWTNVQIILAAVFEELDDAYKKTIRLSNAVSASSVPVVVRTFSMAELNARFGVPPDLES
jgi:hypothetical protein